MKKGIVFGAWDLLHTGHVLMLEECKQYCDYLIVGLHIDPSLERDKKKPVQSLLERQIQLQQCKSVNQVIVYETEEDLKMILKSLDVSMRFLGEDYYDRIDITGKEIIPIRYISREHPWSTSELRERVKNA